MSQQGYRPSYSQPPGGSGSFAPSGSQGYPSGRPSYSATQQAPASRPSGYTPSPQPASGLPSSAAVLEGAKRLRKASTLEEECRSFAEYLNSIPQIQRDPVFQGRIPMNPRDESLFRLCSYAEGLTQSSKFINVIRPGTVDEARLCTKSNRNVFETNNNHALAISGARTLGCVITNIGAEDLSRGTVRRFIRMLWQLIRLSLLSRINLESHPEIIALKEEGEDVRQFVEMAPEMTLLRWFNYHLRAAGCTRRVTNFSNDIRDGDLYARLLHQIAQSHCTLDPLREQDPLRRAELILQEAAKVGCRQFLEPQDIVSGNEKLNLAFVAQLFHAHPKLSAQASSVSFNEQQTREEVARAVAEQLARKESELRQRMAEEESRMRERLQNMEAEWMARMKAEEAAMKEKWRQEEEKRRLQMNTDQMERMNEWEREQARKNEEWLRTQEQQNSVAQQKLNEIERERARVMEERRQLEEERARRSAQRATGYGPPSTGPTSPSSHGTGPSYSSSPMYSHSSNAQGQGSSSYIPPPTSDNPYNTTCPMNVYKGSMNDQADMRPAQGSAMGIHGGGPSDSYSSSHGYGNSSQEPGYHSAMGVMNSPPSHGGGYSSDAHMNAYGGESSHHQMGYSSQMGPGAPYGSNQRPSEYNSQPVPHHAPWESHPSGEYHSAASLASASQYSPGGPTSPHGAPYGSNQPHSAASLASASQYPPMGGPQGSSGYSNPYGGGGYYPH